MAREKREGAGHNQSIVAVVLASAGTGAMNVDKLLLPVAGRAVIAHGIDHIQRSGVAAVILATDAGDGRFDSALPDDGTVTVVAAQRPRDRHGALKAALAHLPQTCDAFVVCQGNMPAMPASVIDALIAAYDPKKKHLIAIPVFHGKRGQPVLWDRRFAEAMLALSDKQSLDQLIVAHAGNVVDVPVETDLILLDLDMPTIFDAYLKQFKGPAPRPRGGGRKSDGKFARPRGTRKIGMRVRR